VTRVSRFLTVAPVTRGENAAFRTTLAPGKGRRRPLHDRADDGGQVIDRFFVHEPAATTADGLLAGHARAILAPDPSEFGKANVRKL
jgi:hypothetical protein